MKQWSREQIMKGLQTIVSEINYLEKSEDVGSPSGGIWTSGEDACIFKGLPPFNHNLEYGEILLSENGDTNPKHQFMKVKEMYVYGIHREIYSWLEERGWYSEWEDPARLLFWKYDKDSAEKIIKNLKNFQVFHDLRENDGIEAEILKRFKEKIKENDEGKNLHV